MHAFNLQSKPLSLAERLADLAVDVLIDEADLSPKPALVDRRGNGAHSDLHLGLMHASALSLWPAFKEMAEAASQFGTVGLPLREALGRIGREGEAAMLATTNGVNTHRGAIWALGLLVAAAALEPQANTAGALCLRAARLALLDDRYAPRPSAMARKWRCAMACVAPGKKPSWAFRRCCNGACRNSNAAGPRGMASRTPGSMRCWRS